jgi:hypothetical protein
VRTSRLALAGSLAAALLVGACASAPSEIVFDLSDPRGDVRLEHPPLAPIGPGTFDLERVVLSRVGDAWLLEATFAEPVREVQGAWVGRDFQAPMLPQTIDVYLDVTPGVGHVETLEGRGVRVSAAEAWDRVLVVSSLADVDGPDLVFAQSIIARGRKVVASFAADAVPAGVRGMLVLVLATSPDGDGRVRPVAPVGDCANWDDSRCTLSGEGPPVLDASAPIEGQRPVALSYREGLRPEPQRTPIVFARDRLVGAAPVSARDTASGAIATLVDEDGGPIASAVVLAVVGDTVTLEVIGKADITRARAVVFAGPAPR